jgi:transcriptional regulator with XRE-family HTH domain
MEPGLPTRKHIRCPLCYWASYGGSKDARHACRGMPPTLTGHRQSPPLSVRLRIMEGDDDGALYEFRKWKVEAGLAPGPDGTIRATLLACPFCGHVGMTPEKLRSHACARTHPAALNTPRHLPAAVCRAIITGLPEQAKRLMKEITDAEQEEIAAHVAEFKREQAERDAVKAAEAAANEQSARRAREPQSVPLAAGGLPALVSFASELARREGVRVKLGFQNAGGGFDFMEFAPGPVASFGPSSAALIAAAPPGMAARLLFQPAPATVAPTFPAPVKREREEPRPPLPAQTLNSPSEFGQWLARLRKRARLSQPVLGARISKRLGRHFAHSTLAAWELGGRMTNADLLPALADALGVSLDELLRGKPATKEGAAKTLPAVNHQAEPLREAA